MSDLGDRALNEEVDRQVAIEKAQAAGPMTDSTPGEVRLSEAERERHGRWAGEFPAGQLVYSLTDVERILAARLAARDASSEVRDA